MPEQAAGKVTGYHNGPVSEELTDGLKQERKLRKKEAKGQVDLCLYIRKIRPGGGANFPSILKPFGAHTFHFAW